MSNAKGKHRSMHKHGAKSRKELMREARKKARTMARLGAGRGT